MEYRVSHAQNREDILIAAFFPEVASGHYVDVGAGHPDDLSVTKLLYDRGWSGINIEPIPELAAALRAERPRDVTLEVALAATAGVGTFRQYRGWGLSTLNPETIAEHDAQPNAWTEEYSDYSVEITTLAQVLDDHSLPHLHLLKLDVEGAEYDVLAGADWERFRPELVCIETNHIRTDWFPLLREAGYEQVFHDGLNAYLLSTEARHRATHFDYADVVLNGPIIVTPVIAAELEAAAQLHGDIAAARHETATAELAAERLRLTIAERDATIAELTTSVAELDATATDLAHSLTAESELRLLYAERHAEVAARLTTTEGYLAEILGSTSWRITYPLRRTIDILRARLPRRLLVRLWRRFRAVPQRAPDGPVNEPMMSPEASAVLQRMRELE